MIKNIFLKILSKKIISKNKKYLNIHKNDECYIFGNGLSLKYYDLSLFNDRVGIACGPVFSHKDFRNTKIKYLYEGHPFFFYRIWKNPYRVFSIEKNLLGNFYKNNLKKIKDVDFFCSLSNYFGIRGENVNFLHHFNKEFKGYNYSSINNEFTSMKSSLMGMIGLSINMGFKRIILVGCDYCMTPSTIGHFFEKGDIINNLNFNENSSYLEQFKTLKNINIDISILTPNSDFSSTLFKCITYQELMNSKPKFSKNTDLISNEDLKILNDSGMNYKIY